MPPVRSEGSRALLDWLADMRAQHRIVRDFRGIYQVFRYADVTRIMSDYATFSSDITRLTGNAGFDGGSLMLTDPPLHRKLRRLVSSAFTPRMVEGLVPRITEMTHELLDEIDVDSFDMVELFAHPLPVMVIAEVLGVPLSDRDLFRTWADRLVALQVDDPTKADLGKVVGGAMREMGEFLMEHVKDRKVHPRDDLISELLAAEVDGERLRDEEVVNSSCLLLLAGQITSTMALGNALLCLQATPDAEAELRADPSLIPGAFEEVLRQRPPLTQAARITTTEVEIGEEKVPPNSMVISWLLSANYDPEQFPDPDRFDIHRQPNKQYAFGHGIHFCLGAPLARVEGVIALELLFQRFAEIHPAPDAEQYLYEDPMFGVKRLPVTVRRAT
jgi:cytochrome P450